MPIRLGVVPYLNALPLHWSLRGQSEVEIVADFPANLGARLQNGEFDAALLPAADHLRGIGDGILGDAIVGATREVRSVLLFSKVEIERIESVALDASSHSSVALIRIILGDFYRLQPDFFNHRPDLAAMLHRADAALLIGDPALETAQNCAALHLYDLAALWHHFTGLSFVFAAWTAKSGLENRGALEKRLDEARDVGETQISPIVAANPLGTSLPVAVVESYLRGAIEYRLTPAHRAGMEEFGRRMMRREK